MTYTDLLKGFLPKLEGATGVLHVAVAQGRKFDRVVAHSNNGERRFFVDKTTGDIFGAKSTFQYNPRRWYGTLSSAHEMDWNTLTPFAETTLERTLTVRESNFKLTYKPRGRPVKVKK